MASFLSDDGTSSIVSSSAFTEGGTNKPQLFNGFSLYMHLKRPELERKGHTFPMIRDLALFLEDQWDKLEDSTKIEYREMAQARNEMLKRGVPMHICDEHSLISEKDDSQSEVSDVETIPSEPIPTYKPKPKYVNQPSGNTGNQFLNIGDYRVDLLDKRMNTLRMSFNDLKVDSEKKIERCMYHRTALNDLLKGEENPLDVTFTVAKFTTYVADTNHLCLPAEIGLTAFNIREGIVGNFSTLIDVGEIPAGYGFTARKKAEELCVPNPPYDNRVQNYKIILERLKRFVENHPIRLKPASDFGPRKLNIYTLGDDEMEITIGCLNWLHNQVGIENPYEVFSFADAMMYLSSANLKSSAQADSVSYMEKKKRVIEKRMQNRGEESSSDMESFDSSSNTSTISSSMLSSSREGSIFDNRRERRFAPRSTLKNDANDDDAASTVSHPYTECIKFTADTNKPGGITEEEWTSIVSGIFIHPKQVETYLFSLELTTVRELSCLYHMQPKAETAFPLCPLNCTNRYAYNIIDSFMGVMNKQNPEPCYHVPSVGKGQDNNLEIQRREEMIKKYNIAFRSDEEFQYDPKIPPPFFKPIESSGFPD